MNGAWIVVAVVTAVILGGGVVLGALFFSLAPQPAQDPVFVEPPAPVVEAPEPEPMLEAPATDSGSLQARVAELERQVAQLTAALEDSRRETKPILDLYEQMKSGGVPELGPPDDILPGGMVLEDGMPTGGALARKLGRSLGFDDKRRSAFEQQVQRVLEQAKALEKQNATVSVDGDTTKIAIAAYGRDGEQLRSEWSDWLSANFTADERAAYQKEGGDNALFGSRLGQTARAVTIKEAGGSIRLTESSQGAGGEEFISETMGPAAGREFVLQDYLHLLK